MTALRAPLASTLLGVISALAAVGSMFIAWRSVELYPSQVILTERLKTCISLRAEALAIAGQMVTIRTAWSENDIPAFNAALDHAKESERQIAAHIGTLNLVGPPALANAAREVELARIAVHDGAAYNDDDDEALERKIGEMGKAISLFDQACQRAVSRL